MTSKILPKQKKLAKKPSTSIRLCICQEKTNMYKLYQWYRFPKFARDRNWLKPSKEDKHTHTQKKKREGNQPLFLGLKLIQQFQGSTIAFENLSLKPWYWPLSAMVSYLKKQKRGLMALHTIVICN